MANFFEHDGDYRSWLYANPDGYVLNVRATLAPGYAVLHSARCSRVSSQRHLSGAFTERGYRKVCGQTSAELEEWLAYNIPDQQGFSAECSCVSEEPFTAGKAAHVTRPQ